MGSTYAMGGGGMDRWDKELNLSGVKDSALFKKDTYKDPLKHLSFSRKTRSRGNSVNSTEGRSRGNSVSSVDDVPHKQSQLSPKNTQPAKSPSAEEPATTATVSYHSLDASSPSTQVQAILSLSNTVFASPAGQKTKFSSKDTWQDHLKDPNSIIFFATIPSPKSDADVEPIGFLFAYPRKPSQFSDSVASKISQMSATKGGKAGDSVMHIWLCGVLPQYRSQGVFSEMLRLVEVYASEKGLKTMSVATFPFRFSEMYKLLLNKGWSLVEKVEDTADGKVVLVKDVKHENGV